MSILYKSKAGRYRPVRVAEGPITARYRFIKNASRVVTLPFIALGACVLSVMVYLCLLRASLARCGSSWTSSAHFFLKRATKALISMRECAGCSVHLLPGTISKDVTIVKL